MDMNFSCTFCNKEFDSKKGCSYHKRYCKSNPKKLDPPKKSLTWLESMKKRKGGEGKNQYTNLDWDSIDFEDLSLTAKRKRLFKESNYSCSMCGFSTRRECGGIILEIDHIDGDHTNNSRENLRVLCPNCHALTPNFRNWGRKGKKKSSKRLRKGNKEF